jgi:hypothetical protein
MEKKAMMDYVMNSSFWPSLCHEDKVYSPLQLWDFKTKISGPDVVFDIVEPIPLVESINTSVTMGMGGCWGGNLTVF